MATQSKHPQAVKLRALIKYDEQHMPASTLESARAYLADFPQHAAAWLYLADTLDGLARHAEALKALRCAAKLMPHSKSHLVHFRIARSHENRGALKLAEKWYRRAADADPDDTTYHIFLGAMLARCGRFKEAEAVHRRATKCKRGDIDEAFLNLGFVLRAQERYAEARDCFKRALKFTPDYKAARAALADVNEVLELIRRRSAKRHWRTHKVG